MRCSSILAVFAVLILVQPSARGEGLPRLPAKLKITPAGAGLSVEHESKLLRVADARREFGVTGQTCAVAIVDSGIFSQHSDFGHRVAVELDFQNVKNGVPGGSAPDGMGHGTAVAGIIAGNRPGPDIGMAPDSTIVALRVFDADGNTSWHAVAAALKWVREHASERHICAVNLSLGDGENYRLEARPRAIKNYREVTTELDALYQARVPIIAAAGNGYFTDQTEGMEYPAVLKTVISVGAVSGTQDSAVWRQFSDDSTAERTGPNLIAPFSQRLLSIAAPLGTKIFAPGAYISTASLRSVSAQDEFSGTSDATPLVTGVVLLMNEYYRHASKKTQAPPISNIVAWLQAGIHVTDIDGGQDSVPHSGKLFVRLDALCALRAEAASLGRASIMQQDCQ
jgi:subtilisin family serine protease